jgi:branched-chain amino acid aminotransferase
MLWLNGHQIQGHMAPFDLRDRGLLLGDGVFDTAMILNGAVVYGADHIDRLMRTCAAFGLAVDVATLNKAYSTAAKGVARGIMRATITRGCGQRGLAPPPDAVPMVMISTQPSPLPTLWHPIKVLTSDIRRNDTSPTSRHKTLNYLDGVMALQSAQTQGADEALFHNTKNRAACCATGNVFVLHGTTFKTPPLSEGALNGIIRAKCLQMVPQMGDDIAQTPLTATDFTTADAVFMTNSLRLIAPITQIDARPVAIKGLERVYRLARAIEHDIQRETGAFETLDKGYAAWPIPA